MHSWAHKPLTLTHWPWAQMDTFGPPFFSSAQFTCTGVLFSSHKSERTQKLDCMRIVCVYISGLCQWRKVRHTDCLWDEDKGSMLLALGRLDPCKREEGNLRASAHSLLFLHFGLHALWDLSKAAASKCDQPPLTAAFSSAPRTRLLSKHNADSLINRGVRRGARSIFSHLFHSHRLSCADPFTAGVRQFIKHIQPFEAVCEESGRF